jgi:hypothetical protein
MRCKGLKRNEGKCASRRIVDSDLGVFRNTNVFRVCAVIKEEGGEGRLK